MGGALITGDGVDKAVGLRVRIVVSDGILVEVIPVEKTFDVENR
jgi:hypothetical protein